jgi:beta-xylosidase
MVSAEKHPPVEIERVPVQQSLVYLKAECDFNNRTDRARFYYSLDGKSWKSIGGPLKMTYNLAHFMGYRFGLFTYATKEAGGSADFDYFRVSDKMTNPR